MFCSLFRKLCFFIFQFSLFTQLSSSLVAQVYDYDVNGEWKIPEGISGAAARIRFFPAGELLASKLEIAGLGLANDFLLSGPYARNESSQCGANKFISACYTLRVVSTSKASLEVTKCESLPGLDYSCTTPLGTIINIERPTRVDLSGIWDNGEGKYFLVTHSSDGTLIADPVTISGAGVDFGYVFQGNISVSDGTGLVSGTDDIDGYTATHEFLSATDSILQYKTVDCVGNCADELEDIGVIRIATRIGGVPRYNN